MSKKEIKEIYEIIRNKYKLPDFKELNEEFDIGKIEFNADTVLRDIRKAMMSKLSSSLQLIELLLNPTNGSMFNMLLTRNIESEEKLILEKLFDTLGQIEINSYVLDIEYSEKNEAEFIISKTEEWKIISKEINKTLRKLGDDWKKSNFKKAKSYFG
ncbi:hypothetical protein COU56_04875 [Candidatus Pacearchaeota archaeon CG10_big_fil_rev_8_21_14_0_10_31_9]|nr:MAG: hypothetical protein AUJ62_00365 [Candidatus Pacearchaeota archaeon CG1_02_32_21]PIN91665.1 MAG: hypothetical protein COU56_04875 [Candidatus Pacearchaeota archaeon CG10_big_fil_rev_8_21_14_0_10_31_9]PIZ82480.1 MAG: hypothetical protein COX97_04645 [Candidatus Pacearchaeota archaeon CG_4_10_14_0_2_um_filter_05_32_18]